MQNVMTVSVVICAYTEERWDDLAAAVASVQQQTIPPQEIIVVIDHNPQLLARAKAHFQDVIVIENSEARGLSGGRNSGVRQAQSEIVAFLDDDAIATPGWLQRLCYHLQDPQVMGAGGVVEAMWETGRPLWFPAEFNWVVGCSYHGLPDQSAPVRNLFGGCMCVRREVFEAVGGFCHGIGRDEKRPMGCEETELCIRANQHWPERTFFYEPLAWAYHRVPANRARWQYFRSRCYAEGLSKALVTQSVGAKDGLAAEWRYTLYTLPRAILRYLQDVRQGDLNGFGRAGAVVGGLAFTTAGYLKGKAVQRWQGKKLLPMMGNRIQPKEKIA